ncbi:UDPGP type 1 family protein [Oceanirhabdus sp. W0125-5]|uniref:UDPGP type 1 family protein n=1 Tax=Oceanirhabdus sp. W0125-5 TaxID=2999116 RepID=UPI0022F2FBFA|nr:UDPGP type 1 family protein [Oceanirhabdus sp. W0125-5]WBW99379.1 UDPGP type 1 family protein [Oceanirhabdus sp. W0125-5]
MNDEFNKAIELVNKYKQEHLLRFYHFLNNDKKSALINDILTIDFELIQNIYNKIRKNHIEEKENQFKPLIANSLKMYSDEEKNNFYKIGMNALANGKVAVYLVAGGQGTRLGHNGPKGTFDIGLPSRKSLFQLQCERLIYLSNKCKKYIPLYIMTSIENHHDTVSFFKEHNYFGYPKSMIMFFKQKTMPTINEDGKVLLSDENKIAMSPNGNGGCFVALKDSGALGDMKAKGIEWLFLYGIDNALVRVADPYFIGFTICSNKPAASKVVEKKYPEEKVGVLCYKNNKPAIVEYSEIPKNIASEVDQDGKLIYSNANILNHILSVDFIETIAGKPLPLHIAHKKIEYIDEHGKKILPINPNGYKFEYFLFDIFEMLDDMAALEVKREEEFAPVKNSEGEDSPQTAKELILNLHKKWLINAGVDNTTLKEKQIEISPLVSYYGDNLSGKSINEI